jgi:ribosomal protein S18 acetylase RimI-like enzyme
MRGSRKKECVVVEGSAEDTLRCAEIACNSEIGRRYAFLAQELAEKMKRSLGREGLLLLACAQPELEESSARSVAAALGFAWVEPKGAFGQAPYLKLIAVDEEARGSGVGALLLTEFERRTASSGNAWLLLVSDFNQRAISFYERHGYVQAGRLPSFAKEGIDEIIMYKHH